MASTLEWLRSRDDAALVALLAARPDLTVPAPGDLGVLAGRLNGGPSVWRAMESLDQFQLRVLEGLAVLGADHAAVPRERLAGLLGPSVPAAALTEALVRLETLALVRGTDELRMPASVSSALGPHPAGLGRPGELTQQQVRDALPELPGELRAILERLSGDRPRGAVDPDSQIARGIDDLLARRLLRRHDASTVELPLEVGLVLRGDRPLGPMPVSAPLDAVRARDPRTVDGTAGGQALATVSVLARLLELLGTAPAPALKSGGLGIRELRRLAKILDLDEHLTALSLELLAAADLIATSNPRGRQSTEAWTPTKAADAFLALTDEVAWAQVATTWLDLRRDPSRVGARDSADKVINALSLEMSWARAPAERRFVLDALAELPAGSGFEVPALTERLYWQAPLRASGRRPGLVAATMAEATALGMVAFDALSGAARAVLAGDPIRGASALADALPAPVDRVVVQADLTVVAPGRLVPTLAARLGQVADVESAGSATVYRVTPASLRRAMDAGVTSAEVHDLFAQHSATGVPQALTYLIDDVGRRYGVLRIGGADAYLRSDDPSLLDQAMAGAAAAGIPLRRLAPTVAVAEAGIEDLLGQLREQGLVPAAEDFSGALVDIRAQPQRTRDAPRVHLPWREPPAPTAEQLGTLVTRMRRAEVTSTTTGQTPSQSMTMLRRAVQAGQSVWIGYVDSEGTTTHRQIEPVAVSGGAVTAFDHLRAELRVFALHRITSVQSEDHAPGVAHRPDPQPARD